MAETGNRAMSGEYSKCILHDFFSEDKFPRNPEGKINLENNEGAVAVEVDLRLRLSLKGSFGVEAVKDQKLERSDQVLPTAADSQLLTLTASLPTETAMETEKWRKRKEQQWLRRMDAKMKRIETGKDKVGMQNPYSVQDFPNKFPILDTSQVNAGASTTKPDVQQAKAEHNTIMRLMPCVSTRGDAPNCRKVDGFLYKYHNKEVCIVCACHGHFLSAAEFVMHGGGGDVENPLKHITVRSFFI